jgi:hypothetical protein
MASIASTTRSGVTLVSRTTATASDTFTYVPNTSQVLEIHNNTAGPLTVTIKGSAPSAAFPVPGVAGLTTNLTAGLSLTIAANATYHVALDSIAPYLAGNGTVTVAGATGSIVTLLTN